METVYLDNAATSFPKPERVRLRAVEEITQGAGSPGRGFHIGSAKASSIAAQARRKLAKFFGVLEDYRVIFTYSATDSLNTVIKGFLNDGDRAVISGIEHNSVLRPLKGMERDGRISLEIAACDSKGYLDTEDLRKKLRASKTRLVAVNHASNVTGAMQDAAEIGRIAREEGAYFLLDAAQTAGTVPIDIEGMNIDFLAFAGHKGLYGLQGTGGLILGSRVRGLRPFREGGTGFNSASETQPVNWPEAYESGTHNVPGIAALSEGIDFINEEGIETIAEKESLLLKALWGGLKEYENITLYGPSPEEKRSAVLSFNIKGWDAEDVGNVLSQNHGVMTRTGLHCAPLVHKILGTFPEGTVRLSPGYFNSMEDIEKFLNVIETIATVDVPWY